MAPLLQYLESFDQSGSDSGIENSSRHSGGHTVVSTKMKFSSDTTSTATDEGGCGESLLSLPMPYGNRCSSFHGETIESSSGQSILRCVCVGRELIGNNVRDLVNTGT